MLIINWQKEVNNLTRHAKLGAELNAELKKLIAILKDS